MKQYSKNYKYPFQNRAMDEYFASLPSFVQETIMQTGISLSNEQELRAYAEHLMKGNIDPYADM